MILICLNLNFPPEDKIEMTFNMFDTDNSGYIVYSELQKIFQVRWWIYFKTKKIFQIGVDQKKVEKKIKTILYKKKVTLASSIVYWFPSSIKMILFLEKNFGRPARNILDFQYDISLEYLYCWQLCTYNLFSIIMG